jgi:hypothetical protein
MKRQFTMTFNCDDVTFDDPTRIALIIAKAMQHVCTQPIVNNYPMLIQGQDGKTLGCFGVFVS